MQGERQVYRKLWYHSRDSRSSSRGKMSIVVSYVFTRSAIPVIRIISRVRRVMNGKKKSENEVLIYICSGTPNALHLPVVC